MFILNINNFIKFHLDLFKKFPILSKKGIDNIGNKILDFEKEYDKKYSKELINIKKEKKIKNLVIFLLNFIINIQDDEDLDYLKIEEIKKLFSLLFNLNDNQINYIFSIVNDKQNLIPNFEKLVLTNITDIEDYTNMEYINKLCKMFAINLLFFKNYVKLFNVKKIIENFKTKLKKILSKSPNYNSRDYDISYDAESSFLLSSRRKIKSLGNEEKSLKSSFKKKLNKELEEYRIKENTKINTIIYSILKDKIDRLIFYFYIKNISLVDYKKKLDFLIEDKITDSFETTLLELQITEPEYNTNNFEKLQELINYYNKKNNINYYNYGSEAYLLKLLKNNVSINEISEYVEKFKNENEKDNNTYTSENYLKKIGYDLAICLYIFTKISIIRNRITKEEIKRMIKNIILETDEINDDYMKKINDYFNEILNNNTNKNFKFIYSPNTKINLIKRNYLREQFEKLNNDKYKYEQFKYNLYKYEEIEGYDEKNKKPIYLWFINNVVLRFSDI